jgi:16S rRNA (cytosine1402-N4)-methyltransferase
MTDTFVHETVLKRELVNYLHLKLGDFAVDCTGGGGGHTEELLKKVGKTGKILTLDQDLVAIKNLTNKFSEEITSGQLTVIHSKFSEIDRIVLGRKPDAICADLGVSTQQLIDSERGFSFMSEGNLDMRMNADENNINTARELVNNASYEELLDIISRLGEEPKAKFIARAIVDQRNKSPINTTKELRELIEKNVHYEERSRKHVATKTFMALRMAVNKELEELNELLHKSFELLKEGGRLGIISFHSLEDRMVKKFYVSLTGRLSDELRSLPLTNDELKDKINMRASIIRPFPIKPTSIEVTHNPKSRSAKLRVVEKL